MDVPFSFIDGQNFLDRYMRLLVVMDEEQMTRAVRNLMNLMVVTSHEFERRFPDAYARWAKEIDG